MAQPDEARTVLATLRPQPYSKGSSSHVVDPIVEPLWPGLRVLAAVDDAGAVLADEEGDPVADHERVVIALGVSIRAGSLILDGTVTKQILRDEGAMYTAGLEEVPTVGSSIGRMFFGRHRARVEERIAEAETAAANRVFHPDELVTFVATDLLWLDGESLLDVPLLERKRVLESVLIDGEVIRVGMFVRPPIEHWGASWRAQGFAAMTMKSANSHYSPGVATKDWTITSLPRR